MIENTELLTSSAAHKINNHLMVVMTLLDVLEKQLGNLQDANRESVQLVCRIRRAAADAANVTNSYSGNCGVEPI